MYEWMRAGGVGWRSLLASVARARRKWQCRGCHSSLGEMLSLAFVSPLQSSISPSLMQSFSPHLLSVFVALALSLYPHTPLSVLPLFSFPCRHLAGLSMNMPGTEAPLSPSKLSSPVWMTIAFSRSILKQTRKKTEKGRKERIVAVQLGPFVGIWIACQAGDFPALW